MLVTALEPTRVGRTCACSAILVAATRFLRQSMYTQCWLCPNCCYCLSLLLLIRGLSVLFLITCARLFWLGSVVIWRAMRQLACGLRQLKNSGNYNGTTLSLYVSVHLPALVVAFESFLSDCYRSHLPPVLFRWQFYLLRVYFNKLCSIYAYVCVCVLKWFQFSPVHFSFILSFYSRHKYLHLCFFLSLSFAFLFYVPVSYLYSSPLGDSRSIGCIASAF